MSEMTRKLIYVNMTVIYKWVSMQNTYYNIHICVICKKIKRNHRRQYAHRLHATINKSSPLYTQNILPQFCIITVKRIYWRIIFYKSTLHIHFMLYFFFSISKKADWKYICHIHVHNKIIQYTKIYTYINIHIYLNIHI